MTQDINNPLHFSADEGKTFVRISDSERIGWEIYLAEIDSIVNYEELEMTDEEKEMKRKEEEGAEERSKRHDKDSEE